MWISQTASAISALNHILNGTIGISKMSQICGTNLPTYFRIPKPSISTKLQDIVYCLVNSISYAFN